MPLGKLTIERNGLIGVRYVVERVSRAHQLVPAINAGKHQVIRRIDVHRIRHAGRVYPMHAHAGDIAQHRPEPGGLGRFRGVESGDLLLQSSHLQAIHLG